MITAQDAHILSFNNRADVIIDEFLKICENKIKETTIEKKYTCCVRTSLNALIDEKGFKRKEVDYRVSGFEVLAPIGKIILQKLMDSGFKVDITILPPIQIVFNISWEDIK